MIVGGVISPSTEPQSRNPRKGALLSVGGQGQSPGETWGGAWGLQAGGTRAVSPL